MNHTFSPKVANLWSSYSAARESFDFGEQIYSEILFVQQHRNDGASSTLIFLEPKLRKLINKYSLKRHYLKSRLFQWISRIWLLCVLVLGHFSHVQLFVIPWAVDCSLPSSSVWGILQERTLEWVAISSSRGSSQLRNRTLVSRISCTAGRFFFTTIEPRELLLQLDHRCHHHHHHYSQWGFVHGIQAQGKANVLVSSSQNDAQALASKPQ